MALTAKMKRLSFNSNSSKSTKTSGSDSSKERPFKPSTADRHPFTLKNKHQQTNTQNIPPKTLPNNGHNKPKNEYDHTFLSASSTSDRNNQSSTFPSSRDFDRDQYTLLKPQKRRDSLYNTCSNASPKLSLNNLNTDQSTDTELVDIDLSTLALYQRVSANLPSNTLESSQSQSTLNSTYPSGPPGPLLDSPRAFSFSNKASSPIQLGHQDNHHNHFFSEPTHPIVTRDRDSELNVPLVFDIESFQSYLLLAEFRTAFRDWLSLDPEFNHDGLLKLDRWMDEMKAESLVKAVREYSLSLFGVYHANGNQARSSFLPGAVVQEALSNLSRLAVLESGLQSSRSCLVTSLHENEFHSFIRAKLIARITDRRNVYTLSDANSEIHRPSFCLTNPRVTNNPIVMVSPELLQLTRYEASEVIGKTCQLFYGIATSPSSIYRVGNALEEGQSCVEILLTYRKDGSSTYCLWTFDPLLGPDGEVMFFVARQTDVAKDLNVPLVRFLGLNISRTEEEASAATTAQLGIEEEMPCSPRMQNHRHHQRHLITNNDRSQQPMKNLSRNVRTYTATSTSGGGGAGTSSSSIYTGRGDRSPSVTKNFSHPTSITNTTKKDWLTNGVTSVKDVLRRGGGGSSRINGNTQKFDGLNSSTFCSRTCKPSHYLMVIKRRDHRIMYANENILKFFGLPTKSTKDVYDPPLSRKDLLRLLYGRNEKETKGLRNFVEELLARGRAGCCECELNYDQVTIEHNNNDDKGPERVSLCGELSSLHFTPLISATGHCALYVVSFDSM